MIDIEALEALEKAATPGDWAWQRSGKLKRVCAETAETEYYGNNNVIGTFASQPLSCKQADRDFIAASRNALPAILRELRAAREIIAVARLMTTEPASIGYGVAAHYSSKFAVVLAAYDAASKGGT